MSRFKFGVTQWGMPGEGHYSVRIAKEAGLDGMQIELGGYESGYGLAQKYVMEKYIEDSAKYGIEFPSLVTNDLGVNGFVEGRQSESGKIAYETMRIGIETAAAMKITTIMIPNFFANWIANERHFDNTVEALIFCCDFAAKHNIVIASETGLSPEDHFRLLDQVNRPNIGIFFDCMNARFFGKRDQLDTLMKELPRFVPQLHIKDGIDQLSGALLGEGNMDFFNQADYLVNSNFSGWIILENYYSHLPIRGSNTADQIDLLRKDLAIAKKAFNAV